MNPLQPEFLGQVARVLGYLFALFVFFAARYGLVLALALLGYLMGARLTRQIRYMGLLEKLAFSTALGLGALGLLVFLLGLAGLLYPTSLLIVALGAIAFAFPVWRGWGRKLRVAVQSLRGLGGRKIAFGLMAILTLAAVLSPFLLLPLYPATAWDATSYHLPIARLYVESHRVVTAPFLRYPLFPQLGEMLFAVALTFSDAVSAQLTQFAMLVIVLAGCFAFCKRFFSHRAAWWAVAMVASYPLVVWGASVAYIDVTLMAYVFFAVYALEIALRERDRQWFILCGVFAGFAAGTKYTALFFAGVLGLLVLVDVIRTKKVSELISYGASLLVVASPYYIRNFIVAGNPVWPFLSDLFGYWMWNADDLWAQMQDLTHAHVVGRSLIDFLRLPWDLSLRIRMYHHEAALSPFFLAVPLGIFGIRHATVRRLLLIAFSFLGFWFLTTQIPRYLLPVLPIFSISTAWAVDQFLVQVGRWAKGHRVLASMVVTAVGVVLFAAPGWIYTVNRLGRLGLIPVTPQQRERFLTSHLPTYSAYAFLNSVKGNEYVLYALYDENMAYYAEGVVMGDHFGVARYSHVLVPPVEGEVLYDRLRRFGADHLLVNLSRTPIRFPFPGDAWFAEHFVVLFASPHALLYELTDRPVRPMESTELLGNPGFEDLDGDRPIAWGASGRPEMDAFRPRTGSLAVRGLGTQNVFYQSVPVDEGGLYVLRQYARADAPGQWTRLQVNWLDGEGRFLSASIRVVGVGPQWQQHEMWVSAPTGAVHAEIYASPHEDSVVCYDDFSFVRLFYGE